MASKCLTKPEDSQEEAFFEQAVISLLKVAEGEGGGGGSPPSWLAMAVEPCQLNPQRVKPYPNNYLKTF